MTRSQFKIDRFLSVRAAGTLLMLALLCGTRDLYGQFRGVNEVTGNSDGAVASSTSSTAVGKKSMADRKSVV